MHLDTTFDGVRVKRNHASDANNADGHQKEVQLQGVLVLCVKTSICDSVIAVAPRDVDHTNHFVHNVSPHAAQIGIVIDDS